EQSRSWYTHQAEEDAIVAAVQTIAAARGLPMAQVAMAWVMTRPGITGPVIGASKPHHLDDAVAALSIRLSDGEVAALEAPYRPREVAGHR
uniref:aldo/keto reductase n=1 Tax=Ferrovibrio sp. TaxID=1917215 RepID=UPI00312038E4